MFDDMHGLILCSSSFDREEEKKVDPSRLSGRWRKMQMFHRVQITYSETEVAPYYAFFEE